MIFYFSWDYKLRKILSKNITIDLKSYRKPSLRTIKENLWKVRLFPICTQRKLQIAYIFGV